MNRTIKSGIAGAAAVFGVGCSTIDYTPPREIANVAIPVLDTTPKNPWREKEPPPVSGPARPFAFPKVASSELKNGLKVAVIQSKALPIVQIRVVVLGGRAADGERPGLSSITGDMLKDGGAGKYSSKDLVTRVESLGSSLSIGTDTDATVLSMAVTKDRLGEALDLLGTVVREPRFAQNEFDKLKKRELDRTADAARTNGRWSGAMILWRDLFSMPSDHHPYASVDATPAEIAKISLADVRAMHKRLFVPKNTFVVVAGDTTPDVARAAVDKAFAGYRGGEAPVISFTDPMPQAGLKITVVDRPKSSQSDLFVGALGPERADKMFPAFAVANQILGGGVSGRLFLDVREKQSLAYATRSSVIEVAHGPSVISAYAGTQTAKTGLAMKGLLEHLDRLGTTAPSAEEVDTSTRYLSDVFAIKLETIGAVADELAHLRVMGLPDDYDDAYRKQIRDVTPALALKAVSDHVRRGHGVVVAVGDAAVIGPMLSHFGEVKVVDPTRNFERVRTLPMNASAPLEVERQQGR